MGRGKRFKLSRLNPSSFTQLQQGAQQLGAQQVGSQQSSGQQQL